MNILYSIQDDLNLSRQASLIHAKVMETGEMIIEGIHLSEYLF